MRLRLRVRNALPGFSRVCGKVPSLNVGDSRHGSSDRRLGWHRAQPVERNGLFSALHDQRRSQRSSLRGHDRFQHDQLDAHLPSQQDAHESLDHDLRSVVNVRNRGQHWIRGL